MKTPHDTPGESSGRTNILKSKDSEKSGVTGRKKKKKKKPLWKRILKWTGITFLILLILVILLPIIFKGKIIRMAKEEMNNQLNAKVDFDEDNVDLEFITTFPVFTLTLHDVTVDGVGVFDEVRLADIGSLQASLDLNSVIFGDQIEVNRIALTNPVINILVLEDGTANYDIAKEDTTATDEPEEPSNFKLALKEYSITGGHVVYDDKANVTYIEMKDFEHKGSGDITADVFKLETYTRASQITFGYDGVNYLTRVNTEMDADFDIDMSNDFKLAFHNNKIRLNNLNLMYDGEFIMADDYYDMSFDFAAEKAGFKEFLSLVPAMYATDFAGMDVKGDFEFAGNVKGKYSDASMPGFDVKMKVTDGYVKYADLPEAISGIQLETHIGRGEGLDFDNTVIEVQRLHMNLGNNTVDAVLNIVNPISDPGIQAFLKANVDLATISKYYPLGNDPIKGKLKADIELAGRLSAVENEQYENFKANGYLQAQGMEYNMGTDMIKVDSLLFTFAPEFLQLSVLKASGMGTDIAASGKIDNYLGYFFRDELLKGAFNVHAGELNADVLLAPAESTEATESITASDSSGVAMAAPVIPGNIDFNLKVSLDELIYNNIPITNVLGNVQVKEGVAYLNDLTLNAFDGAIGLKGVYDSRTPEKPKIDFGYSINNVDIPSLAKGFVSLGKLAPVAEYCKGRLSSDFTLKGVLGEDMMPEFSSLTGDGSLVSKMVTVEGFEPMSKLAGALNMEHLSTQTLQDVKVLFEFADGRVNVKPYTVKLGKIPATISGFTTFEEVIDYDLEFRIPKSEIPQQVIKAAEQAMGQAAKLGLDLGQLPSEIPVHADVTGTVRKPEVKTDFKEQLLALTGNLKDAVKEKLKEELDKKVEEVKEKVEEKVEEVKEDVKAKVEQIMQEAQQKADKIKAEAKILADQTRAEGEKQAKALEDAAKNPIEKQGAKIAAKKVRDEANKKADIIENEAQKKVDGIMTEARKKTDELEKK